MAITARKRMLDMAAADKIQIAAYHLPFPSTGFISKQRRRLRIPSGLLAAGAVSARQHATARKATCVVAFSFCKPPISAA